MRRLAFLFSVALALGLLAGDIFGGQYLCRRKHFRESGDYVFYDDFEAGNLDKWTIAGGSATIVEDPDSAANHVMRLYTNSDVVYTDPFTHISTAIDLTFKLRFATGGQIVAWGIGDGSSRPEIPYLKIDNASGFQYYPAGGPWSNLPTATSANANTWYTVRLYDYVFGATDTCKIDVNGVYKGTLALASTNATYLDRFYFAQNAGGSIYIYFDDVYIQGE